MTELKTFSELSQLIESELRAVSVREKLESIERKRLSEFVDLCERLKKLKDSGFLDTVADTMIRLATCEKIAIGGF